jgi:hypothetical protein
VFEKKKMEIGEIEINDGYVLLGLT